MIRRILVPTDGSENAALGQRYAIGIAKRYEAFLHALHVVDIKLLEGPFLRDVSASLGTAPYLNYQGNINLILEERGKAILEGFRDACEKAGVQCQTTLTTGIVPRAITENSDLADLIVMTRGGEHEEWLDGLVGSTTEAVVRRGHKPVIVTNTDVVGEDLLVVAYDGSHNSKNALVAAASICDDWRMRMHVLTVGREDVEYRLNEARSYLQTHSIDAEYLRREGDPSETIVLYADEVGADLLVLGAYGHTKVRQLVVGSSTSYAMSHAGCPLLLVR